VLFAERGAFGHRQSCEIARATFSASSASRLRFSVSSQEEESLQNANLSKCAEHKAILLSSNLCSEIGQCSSAFVWTLLDARLLNQTTLLPTSVIG
jgi:uncharacterized protein YjbI with pentapeptide repeats